MSVCSLKPAKMKNEREVNEVRYAGVDVGKKRCRAAIRDDGGALVEELNFINDFSGIEGFVQELSEGDSVVMEFRWKPLGSLVRGC